MNSNENLAGKAVLGVVKVMAIKWAIIFVVTRSARKVAENMT